MAVPGNWNLFGVNLPDFGISEKIMGPQWGNTVDASKSGLVNDDYSQKVTQLSKDFPALAKSNPTAILNYARTGPAPAVTQPQQSAPDLSNPSKQTDYARSLGYAGWDDYQNFLNQQNNANNVLNSGYDQYYRELDAQLSGLDSQRSAQEQIANNTYNQGYNTATSQYNQGQQELANSKQKTLRDLSNNLMQSWQQGNAYLGTRGASDSSAASQYSYALAKLGSQQRGDVQSQYDQNMFKLKNTYDTEVKNLELSKNNQLQQISQWYSEAQNSLRSQRGQAALQKSQQALSIAMQMAQQVQAQVNSKRATLDQWVANHAQSFGELQKQLAQTSQWSMPAPNNFTIGGGTPQNYNVSAGYGTDNTKKDMLGNMIY